MLGVLVLAAIVAGLIWYLGPVWQAGRMTVLPIVDAARTTLDARAYRYSIPDGASPALVRIGGVPTPVGATSVVENTRFAVVPLYEDLGPLRLVVIDKSNGEQREIVILDAKFAYGLCFDREHDDRLWIATSERAKLFQLELSAGEPELIWQSAEDSHIFALDQAQSGELYLGTYPGRRCYRIKVDDGNTSAQLVTIQHPAIAGATYLYRIIATDESLFLSYSAPAVLLRHDLRGAANVELLRSSAPFVEMFRQQTHLWAQQDGRWRGYDLAGKPLADDLRPGPNYAATIEVRGVNAIVQAGDKSFEVSLRPRAGGMGITALDSGAAPRLFGATYWNTWLFEVDTSAREVRGVAALPGGSGEFFHSFTVDGRRQIIPSYQGARYAYDPQQAVSRVAGSSNPRLMSQVADAHYGIASASLSPTTQVYATFPNYHQAGGQLIVLDTQPDGTTREQIVKRIGDDLTLGHLAVVERRLFGGTLDVVGAGVVRELQQTPTLLELDVGGEIVARWPLDNRPDDVTGLVVLDSGRLVCATRRRLFVIDSPGSTPRELPIVHQIKRWHDSHVRKLVRYGNDVLVVTREFLLLYESATDAVRVLARLPVDCTLAAVGADGGLYLANREQLWLIPRESLEAWNVEQSTSVGAH
ncbi:MAG: hypothetical protein JNM18_24120 [Planctomycetaceae bacterium]|nr:hypothetical protein [Planctomycetaceae bacterium]